MSSPVQKRNTRVGVAPSFRPLMSQPCTSPPELAKYTVLPEMATEFSIDTSWSPMSLQQLVVPARAVEHELRVAP